MGKTSIKVASYFGVFLLFVFCFRTSINCYQCQGTDSSDLFQCNEWLTGDIDLEPESCDHVHDAQYCVKHIGRFEARSIDCFQCSSSETINCSDGMIHISEMRPQSCEHVFEAEYCVKSTSLDGGIGAKRFCSSLNLGNYCNYVKQPGDHLTYRTCVFTCTGHGCNTGLINSPSYTIVFVIVLTLFNVLFIS